MRFCCFRLLPLVLTGVLVVSCSVSYAQPEISYGSPGSTYVFRVRPSETDASIVSGNTPHLLLYDSAAPAGKLLLFLPGTGGIADKGPLMFLTTAVQQGYHVISLSYINTPAVSQACEGRRLAGDPDCAAEFRARRAFGLKTTNVIGDEPQDAIVSRLTMLLRYLAEHDERGHWDAYLTENGTPNWKAIALCGQSQGGGMAAFIAMCTPVYKEISFSGGWDHADGGRIARWYYGKNATPAERWYGTYHTDEEAARTIRSTYQAMGIPEDHIKKLALHVDRGESPHTEGVHNPAYKSVWIEMLGSGR